MLEFIRATAEDLDDYIRHTKIIEIIISMRRWDIKRLEKQNPGVV